MKAVPGRGTLSVILLLHLLPPFFHTSRTKNCLTTRTLYYPAHFQQRGRIYGSTQEWKCTRSESLVGNLRLANLNWPKEPGAVLGPLHTDIPRADGAHGSGAVKSIERLDLILLSRDDVHILPIPLMMKS